MISLRKAKHLDATTMFTYSHANRPLRQSEHAYYLSYYIKLYGILLASFFPGSLLPMEGGGGTSLEEANGDVPLDGVAFS